MLHTVNSTVHPKTIQTSTSHSYTSVTDRHSRHQLDVVSSIGTQHVKSRTTKLIIAHRKRDCAPEHSRNPLDIIRLLSYAEYVQSPQVKAKGWTESSNNDRTFARRARNCPPEVSPFPLGITTRMFNQSVRKGQRPATQKLGCPPSTPNSSTKTEIVASRKWNCPPEKHFLSTWCYE